MDEQQFVLRLPPVLAERMRKSLSKRSKKNPWIPFKDPSEPEKRGTESEAERSTFSINFVDNRNATFTCDGEDYPAMLMDLPCIIETHKTADRRTFYKSSDVHQVLVVRMPGEPAPQSENLEDGLSKASRNGRTRYAKPEPQFDAELVQAVENQMKYVVDNKVQFVRKKSKNVEQQEIVIEEDGNEKKPMELVEGSPEKTEVVEGSARAAEEEARTAEESDKAKIANDKNIDVATHGEPSSFPPRASPPPLSLPSASPPLPSPPLPSPPLPSPSASPPPPPLPSPSPSPSPAPSPSPTPVAPTEEEEEEEDDDLAEWAEDMMDTEDKPQENDEAEEEARVMRQLEIAGLERKIEAQKKLVQQQTEQAENTPNPIMKQRLLERRDELQKVLKDLQEQVARLRSV